MRESMLEWRCVFERKEGGCGPAALYPDRATIFKQQVSPASHPGASGECVLPWPVPWMKKSVKGFVTVTEANIPQLQSYALPCYARLHECHRHVDRGARTICRCCPLIG